MNRKVVEATGACPGIRRLAFGFILPFVSMIGLGLHAQTESTQVIDNDTSPYHQALLDYKSGHYDTARTAIDAAEKAKPDDLSIELLKARIMTEQRDFAGGEKLLRRLLTPGGPLEVQLVLGDLLLHKRDFAAAADTYTQALQNKPGDSDIILKIIYAKVSLSDFVEAGKEASLLKPLDPDHPSYYFAKAAIAQATGKAEEADEDIQTVRTIYGITVANRYLKTYLEVFTGNQTPAARAEPPPATATAAPAHP